MTNLNTTKILLLSLLMLTAISLQAQTVDEWFRQKKTQREYLVQQIAALQAYTGVLREGYSIVRQGISTVKHIKNGDLGLHQAFFGSLRLVNPAIAGSSRVGDIHFCQVAIARSLGEALAAMWENGQLKANELEYLEQVQEKVLTSCTRDLEALGLLLTENELEMGDQARLERLETLYQHTLDTFSFTRAFLQEARVLALQRARKQHEAQSTRSLYGLPH